MRNPLKNLHNPFKTNANRNSDEAPTLVKVSLKDVLKHATYCQDEDNSLSLNEKLSNKAKKPIIADLSGLVIPESTNLSKINLAGANLCKTICLSTNFTEASLAGATFKNANVGLANFSYATASNVDFSGTDFYQATFFGTNLSRSTFKDADLSWIDIQQSNLSEANLTGAITDNLYIQDSITLGMTTDSDKVANTGSFFTSTSATLNRRLVLFAKKVFKEQCVKAMTEINILYNKGKTSDEYDGLIVDTIIPHLIDNHKNIPPLTPNQQNAIITYAKNELHKEPKDGKEPAPEFLLRILFEDKQEGKNKQQNQLI